MCDPFTPQRHVALCLANKPGAARRKKRRNVVTAAGHFVSWVSKQKGCTILRMDAYNMTSRLRGRRYVDVARQIVAILHCVLVQIKDRGGSTNTPIICRCLTKQSLEKADL